MNANPAQMRQNRCAPPFSCQREVVEESEVETLVHRNCLYGSANESVAVNVRGELRMSSYFLMPKSNALNI